MAESLRSLLRRQQTISKVRGTRLSLLPLARGSFSMTLDIHNGEASAL